MARAIRRAVKAAVSPAEAVAKEAEEVAADRLRFDVDGADYVTEFEGQLIPDVAKMYADLLLK